MPKQGSELLVSTLEHEWVHVHGPPAEVSGYQEFAQGYFQDMQRRHNIAFREQIARRHNKMGVVKRGNGILKDLCSAARTNVVLRTVMSTITVV
jgi:hypothetical protein